MLTTVTKFDFVSFAAIKSGDNSITNETSLNDTEKKRTCDGFKVFMLRPNNTQNKHRINCVISHCTTKYTICV